MKLEKMVGKRLKNIKIEHQLNQISVSPGQQLSSEISKAIDI